MWHTKAAIIPTQISTNAMEIRNEQAMIVGQDGER